MEPAARVGAVHVRDELIHRRAEHVEVEVRIAGYEWIKGPKHPCNANGAAALALVPFQCFTKSTALCFFADGQDVRPVHQCPVTHAGEAEDEAEEPPGWCECSGRDASGFLCNQENCGGHLLAEPRAPRFFLQADGVRAFVVSDKRADDGSIGKRYVLHWKG